MQNKITNFLKRVNTLEEVISRLAAKDGLSFRQIANSDDIRKGLQARGFKNVPASITRANVPQRS